MHLQTKPAYEEPAANLNHESRAEMCNIFRATLRDRAFGVPALMLFLTPVSVGIISDVLLDASRSTIFKSMIEFFAADSGIQVTPWVVRYVYHTLFVIVALAGVFFWFRLLYESHKNSSKQ